EHGEPDHRDQRQVEGEVVDQYTRRQVAVCHHDEQQEQRRRQNVFHHDGPVLAHADDPSLGGEQVLVDVSGGEHGFTPCRACSGRSTALHETRTAHHPDLVTR